MISTMPFKVESQKIALKHDLITLSFQSPTGKWVSRPHFLYSVTSTLENNTDENNTEYFCVTEILDYLLIEFGYPIHSLTIRYLEPGLVYIELQSYKNRSPASAGLKIILIAYRKRHGKELLVPWLKEVMIRFEDEKDEHRYVETLETHIHTYREEIGVPPVIT